jgi:hypothetical protein
MQTVTKYTSLTRQAIRIYLLHRHNNRLHDKLPDPRLVVSKTQQLDYQCFDLGTSEVTAATETTGSCQHQSRKHPAKYFVAFLLLQYHIRAPHQRSGNPKSNEMYGQVHVSTRARGAQNENRGKGQ